MGADRRTGGLGGRFEVVARKIQGHGHGDAHLEKIEEPDRPIELGHGLVAHDIQPCGAVVHSGVERESTILIVGQQAYVAKEVTRNVGTVEGDVALGANRRVEELDVERPICGRDVRRALRPGRRAQGAEKKG